MCHVGGELFISINAVVECRYHPAQCTGEAANFIRACSQIGD
ncbi:hypothetical protein LCGC14_2574460, partial [marine sediment metagenome]